MSHFVMNSLRVYSLRYICTINLRKMLSLLVYRPPDTDINSFVAIITDILSVIKAERKTYYLLGDFNINLINVSNHIHTAEFLEVM